MKTEADQPPMQQPQLPTLPSIQTLEDECAHSSGESTVLLTSDSPPENKMKSGLGDLFGDVFVTKVVPGKSMFQIVESGLANYKVEETMPLNSNPLLCGKQRSSNTLFCQSWPKDIYVSLPHQWSVREFSLLQETLCRLRGHACIVNM